MSATQAWPNVAEVLCQSFGSYSIFGDDRFSCVTLYWNTDGWIAMRADSQYKQKTARWLLHAAR